MKSIYYGIRNKTTKLLIYRMYIPVLFVSKDQAEEAIRNWHGENTRKEDLEVVDVMVWVNES